MNSYSIKGQFLLESNLTLNSQSLTNLEAAFNLVQSYLSNFANSSDFSDNFASIFGKKNKY